MSYNIIYVESNAYQFLIKLLSITVDAALDFDSAVFFWAQHCGSSMFPQLPQDLQIQIPT